MMNVIGEMRITEMQSKHDSFTWNKSGENENIKQEKE